MNCNNYGFELTNGIDELTTGRECYRYFDERLVICEISSNVMETLEEQGGQKKVRELLTKFDCDYLLFVCSLQVEIRLLFLSDNKRLRAIEFLDSLVDEYGLIKGNEFFAIARVSCAILQAQISDMELGGIMEYFLKMGEAYFKENDWIYAKDYLAKQPEAIADFERFHKKKITWAYVKSTDITPAGKKLLIKSLENESGTEIEADDDLYIMIGSRGEVYYIKKNKFESTYETTDEKLDVFTQMLDFLPEVETVPDGEYISLDEMAHLCYPQKGNGIYAKQLDKRTKVFPADKDGDYFLGRPGDYMAVRVDDLSDIYIIQKDIFKHTYESE